MKVYLAGGMRTEWRERVKRTVVDVSFLDPTTHGLTDAKEYTAWDIAAIKKSDFVFAYFEASNPVGYNLAFELGIAHAWRTPVVLVNEKFADNTRPISMLCETSINVTTLEAGMSALQSLIDAELPSWWFQSMYGT